MSRLPNDQTPCPSCQELLGVSIVHGGKKSCPSCSLAQGHHVFYPFELFGWRIEGTHLQTWCTACRSGKGAPPASGTC